MEANIMTAKDAYRRIHRCLGEWIEGALEDGFEVDPVEEHYAVSLMQIADWMREIEMRIDAMEHD